jgi:hypothetical protein
MTDDPIRLLDDEGSELLKSLISAGREEEPQAAALRRTLVAVGVAGVLSTTSAAAAASNAATAAGASGSPAVGALAGGSASASAAATSTAVAGAAKSVASSTLIVVAKWLAVGALTGTVASSAVYGVSGALTPAPVASSASAVGPTPSAPKVLPRRSNPADEVREIPAPPPIEVPPPPPAVGPAPAAAEPSAERAGSSLAAEVMALDSARQALGAGDAPRTLDLLNGYEARFREPRMLPEVLYLRLEAFTLKGERANAEAVARRILLVYPTSPHAARARAVLGLDK